MGDTKERKYKIGISTPIWRDGAAQSITFIVMLC